MSKQRLFMETTKISADRTAAQISRLLGAAGARAIMMEYGEDRQISAVCFEFERDGKRLPFTMPIRVAPIAAALRGKHRATPNLDERAVRIAWRQAFRWLQAQVAMIETGMVAPEEAFLPYLLITPKQTLFQSFADTGFQVTKALEAPKRR